MENHKNTASKRQSKDTENNQLTKVYDALKVKPMTMLEVDVFTGVMRSNICRYISSLREQNKVMIIRKRKCTISKYLYVNEYTTNPSLFPKSNQYVMNF
ncbi:hypothetical protein F7647_09385 [Tenacibaculum piscium]|uniref:hypothetical protein n=1 Tax=Tenacibaculum piscium TaxID=1458515 RepID=UPI00187B4646|nr:hypothetical protein [Tenacibaculum piscium]MBE7686269.1 hypothetical protein [Tenacibaculum piscium]